MNKTAIAPLPKHVGIILDGNRRWAVANNLPTLAGHEAGAKVALQAVAWAKNAGIRELTLWLLSTENTARPAPELLGLYGVITNLVAEISQTGVKVKIIGSLDSLPAHQKAEIQALLANPQEEAELQVNLAIGYGGRAEIVDAVRSAIMAAPLGEDTEQLSPPQIQAKIAATINESTISQHLYTAGSQHPDLIIRTSGELRLSGFLLWQSMQSELYFSNTLWPEFSEAEFLLALEDYSNRIRRFGA